MAEIIVTKKDIQYSVLIDDSDFELVSKHKWYIITTGGAIKSNYAYAHIDKKFTGMHRLITGIYDKNIIIDHIDRNGLNNCRANLRKASISQNNANRSSAKKARSSFLGVSKHNNRWRATIGFKGKNHKLGLYKTEQEAAIAYDKKAKEFYGEFANINFKDSTTNLL